MPSSTTSRHCWACGRFVHIKGDIQFSYYICVCEVQEVWHPVSHYKALAAFTDPTYMARMGLIDHAERHCPSPA